MKAIMKPLPFSIVAVLICGCNIAVALLCGCISSDPHPVAPSSAPNTVLELQQLTEDPIICTQERDCVCDFCLEHPYQDEDSYD
jgi:hypothetical protein